MEIDITKFYLETAPMDYSASVAEIGNNAGATTWQAANDDSEDYMMLDTEEKREAFRLHVKGFGARDKEEIAAWTNTELNALLIQMIAGDIRESCLYDDRNAWDAYQEQSEKGQVAGNLFQGSDNKIYYALSS